MAEKPHVDEGNCIVRALDEDESWRLCNGDKHGGSRRLPSIKSPVPEESFSGAKCRLTGAIDRRHVNLLRDLSGDNCDITGAATETGTGSNEFVTYGVVRTWNCSLGPLGVHLWGRFVGARGRSNVVRVTFEAES
ncbi:hypothetical protein CLAIMM_06352 [Cladophialophora immunda]|nr:hypothetical protein CLAIMM_06352 [Cladophialophora immunda]